MSKENIKATTLEDIYRIFEGSKALNENEYDDFFVDIYGDKLKRFMSAIQRNTVYEKIFLIAGQMGNGKSTVLNMLKRKSAKFDKYDIKHIQAKDVFDYKDINIIDILIVIGLYLIDNASEDKKEKIQQEFKDELEKLAKVNNNEMEITNSNTKNKEKGISANIQAETSIGLPAILANLFPANIKASLGINYKSTTSIRQAVKETYKLKLRGLLDIINSLIVKSKDKKEILLIIDGLEKLTSSNNNIEKIFTNDIGLLRDLKCFKITTIPIYIKEKINDTNIQVLDFTMEFNQKTKDISNYSPLEEVIKKRIDSNKLHNLIEKDAIELSIKNSGGNIRALLNIIQESALEAMDILEVETITKDIIKDVCYRIGGGKSMTAQSNKDFLKRIQQNNYIDNGDEKILMEMIQANLVYAYCNGKTYYNINPTIENSLK